MNYYRKQEVVAGLGLLLPLGLLVWAAPLAVAARMDPLRAGRAGILAPSALAVVGRGSPSCSWGWSTTWSKTRRAAAGSGATCGPWAPGGSPAAGSSCSAALFGAAGRQPGTPATVRRGRSCSAGLVVASAANTANLLDLRPGRCAKVFLPLWVVGCLLDPGGGAWSAGLARAALAALPFDLREEGMLGDAGANALGAVVGTLLLAGPM